MILAVIPAKRDSSRLQNKNMLKIGGKTLVELAVNEATSARSIDHIVVSTDCDRIEQHARSVGVDVIQRDEDLCGEAPLWDVYEHAWRSFGNSSVTHVVGLQPDNVNRSIAIAKIDNQTAVVFFCSRLDDSC